MSMPPRVEQMMTTEVLAVAPDTSRDVAARLLVQNEVSGAPVIGAGGRPIGVVTLRDLLDESRRSTAEGTGGPIFYRTSGDLSLIMIDAEGSAEGRVDEVMSEQVLSIRGDAPITEAAQRVLDHGVHRLLVLDGEGRLQGILSTLDIVRGLMSLAEDPPEARSQPQGRSRVA